MDGVGTERRDSVERFESRIHIKIDGLGPLGLLPPDGKQKREGLLGVRGL